MCVCVCMHVCMFVHVCRLISRIRKRLHSLFLFTQQGASAMTSKVSEMQVRCLNNLAAAQLKARGACARECHDTSRVLSSLYLTALFSPLSPPPPLSQVEMYKESQATCQKVLEKDPDNVKALFRYGKVG